MPRKAKGIYSGGELLIYAIYRRPSDYPDNYVVRPWRVLPSHLEPLKEQLADDLAGARKLIPRGLARLRRQPGDDPCILETWIT